MQRGVTTARDSLADKTVKLRPGPAISRLVCGLSGGNEAEKGRIWLGAGISGIGGKKALQRVKEGLIMNGFCDVYWFPPSEIRTPVFQLELETKGCFQESK